MARRLDVKIISEESGLHKRFLRYIKTWKLDCNPFWYNAMCDFNATIEYMPDNLEKYKIVMTFAKAHTNAEKIFLMKREDLEDAINERKLGINIDRGLTLGVLKNQDGYIGLNDSYLWLLYGGKGL